MRLRTPNLGSADVRAASAPQASPPGGGLLPCSAGADDGADLTRLCAENAMLRDALERLPQGMSAFDSADRLVLANARYREIWSLPPEAVRPGISFAEIMKLTKGSETQSSHLQPPPSPGSEGTRRREWQLDNGCLVEVVVSRRADGSCVALHDDVTALRAAQSRISFMARHDLLTGLPNRVVLREDLERALSRNKRGEELALLCLDLDRFKPVNDTLGHAAGDALLKQVAERLLACARESDLVVRLGGDEFALVQFGTPQPASSTVLARRLIDAVSRPFDLEGHRVHIGTSIGIAVAPFDGDNPETLMRNADLAMYGAKSEGRGTLRYFEPEMDGRMRARRGLEADLRLAVARGEFELAYQPQFDTDSRTVTGVEALLRWHHPQRGLVSPIDFISLAEETLLIVPIGHWVLEQACRDALAWPSHVRVAVNVSALQFRDGSLLHSVLTALKASGLPPRRLELEITETVLLRDAQQALATLHELRSRGVRVAMDDFGTGYSSLRNLRSFPFDRIKIDRSFVRDAATNPDTQTVIRAIAELGRGLRMQITVEGVETPAQLHAVRAQGCSEIQGFLFSQPRPAAEIPGLIETLPLTPLPLKETLACSKEFCTSAGPAQD
jgi:diguanylate cyclase (GGDEF)-like protein